MRWNVANGLQELYVPFTNGWQNDKRSLKDQIRRFPTSCCRKTQTKQTSYYAYYAEGKKNQTVLKAPIVPQSTWKQRFSHRKDLHLCNLVPCLNLPLINLMTSSIIQSKIHQLILCRQQQHELYRAPNVWLQHTTLVALLWVADSAYKNNIIRSPACNTFSNTLVTVNVCGGFAGPYTVAQDQHTRDGL